MTPAKLQNAIIVGAGLAGGLTATLLGLRGVETTILERRPDPRLVDDDGHRSINLAISHRGIQALRAAGAADAVINDAIPLVGRMIHDETGATHLMPYGVEGGRVYSISRKQLNIHLLNAAEATGKVNIRFNTGVEGVDGSGGVLLQPEDRRKKPVVMHSDIVLGADGAFSRVRESLMSTTRFNFSRQWLEHGYKELTIPANPDGTTKLGRNALHIWPRHNFMLVGLPNPDGSFKCTLFLPFEGEESYASIQTPSALHAFFHTHFRDLLPLMPDLEQEFFNNPTSAIVTVRCSPWFAAEKVLLIGDAAHAIVPFYGQGINAGFENVRLLMLELDNFPHTELSSVLSRWAAERQPEADAISELALHNFLEMRSHLINPAWLVRQRLSQTAQRLLPHFATPLYNIITFSDLPYSEALRRAQRQDSWLELTRDLRSTIATKLGLRGPRG